MCEIQTEKREEYGNLRQETVGQRFQGQAGKRAKGAERQFSDKTVSSIEWRAHKDPSHGD